jgi:uncharacterized repeat protein (TIGR02543 family)
MNWNISYRCDPKGRVLADRHYSRQTIGAANFVKPSRCMVLISQDEKAVWVTTFPFAEYVRHEWAGAWECAIFRNESDTLASDLIIDAVMATKWKYGEPPELGMITFVDPRKVAGTFIRVKGQKILTWGYCFQKAGFEFEGWTKGGLFVLRLKSEKIKDFAIPNNAQQKLF